MNRRGFTLAELLIATVVMGILGVALARMLISDSEFVAKLDAKMSARLSARGAMNTMVLELRMISGGGLLAAAPDSVTARIPYAFGLLCRTVSGNTIASLVPADSATYAAAVIGGVAWRDSNQTYQFLDGTTASTSSNSAACTADSVRVLPGGRLIATSTAVPDTSGRITYLYQIVTYKFAASMELPGRVGLWRQAAGGPLEEIVAPFDSSAGFGFLVGDDLVVQPTPPGNLALVRGLELRLVGASEVTPRGRSGPETFDLRTTVAFLNR